jgi:hypothetical protein
MALKGELMASGMPSGQANRLGLDTFTVVTQVGSSQATALSLTSNCVNVTAGTGGVIITQTHAMHCIANNSGANCVVYPPLGGAINGGTVNAGFTLTTGKTLIVFSAGLNFIANMSA